MRKLGFADRWISLIMACVRYVSYSILINGSPHGSIFPTRGLHQGDPLSPYLFLMCAEGLSSLITKAALENLITGIPIASGRSRLSHLLFADNSLLFCQATFMEWCHIWELIEVYEWVSGQKINKTKTSIFFSKNTGAAFREHILSISRVSSTNRYEKYLGLPSMVGWDKTKPLRVL